MSGILYLCGTPIGNLEDMTFRAVRILKEVTVIAAEDTRHTLKLLNHFAIHTPLVSYHEHNKFERGPELIKRLLDGDDVAVVSDAGMPGISDPGADLVRLAVENAITVVPVPGPSAALAALTCSGLDTGSFAFVGFLNRTKKKRGETLSALQMDPRTLIFYESPYRVKETLAELNECFGPRKAVAARELTKVYEEFVRGTLEELCTYFKNNSPRGEFTIVVEGHCVSESAQSKQEDYTEAEIIAKVNALIDTGIAKKEAIKEVAKLLHMSKREVYQTVLNDGE